MLTESKYKRIDTIFNPKSVAVVGASDNPNKLGFHVMKSVSGGLFRGRVIPINPGKKEIMGIKTFHSLENVEEEIDLCIIVLPAKLVPVALKECVAKNVKGIVLISAGFKEIEDKSGTDIQLEIANLANRAAIPVIGPNTFGIMNVRSGLNASFSPDLSDLFKEGHLAIVSQSGGMSGVIGHLAQKSNIGLSKIIGLGNRCNVEFADMIGYLMEDPDTKVIAVYMEGIENPRKFMDEARHFRGKKPIIVYKSGRSKVSDRVSQSHTGSLAGSYEIYEAAFRQVGILSANDSEELIDIAKALLVCSLPKSPAVAVLTGQAGPSMVACDICEMKGLDITPFTPETQRRINQLIPPLSLRSNPIDLGPAWFNTEAIKRTLQAVLEDEVISSVLLFFIFTAANESDFHEGFLQSFKQGEVHKPIISSLLATPGGKWDAEIKSAEESGVLANYHTPERAARALGKIWEYKRMNAVE